MFCPWVWKIPWRRKWQPTPVLLPRKSHGRRTLVQATVHGVAKSWTRLSNFTLLHLLLGREVMINLDSILKSRDITLPTKVRLVKVWFFLWSCMDVRVGLCPNSPPQHLQPMRAGLPSGARTSLGDTYPARHIQPMRVPLRLGGPGRVAPWPPSEIRADLETGLWCHCSSGRGTWSELPP